MFVLQIKKLILINLIHHPSVANNVYHNLFFSMDYASDSAMKHPDSSKSAVANQILDTDAIEEMREDLKGAKVGLTS